MTNFSASKMYFSGFTEEVQSRLQTAITIMWDNETNLTTLVRNVINNEKQQERRRRVVTEPGVVVPTGPILHMLNTEDPQQHVDHRLQHVQNRAENPIE